MVYCSEYRIQVKGVIRKTVFSFSSLFPLFPLIRHLEFRISNCGFNKKTLFSFSSLFPLFPLVSLEPLNKKANLELRNANLTRGRYVHSARYFRYYRYCRCNRSVLSLQTPFLLNFWYVPVSPSPDIPSSQLLVFPGCRCEFPDC